MGSIFSFNQDAPIVKTSGPSGSANHLWNGPASRRYDSLQALYCFALGLPAATTNGFLWSASSADLTWSDMRASHNNSRPIWAELPRARRKSLATGSGL